jgi:hypothetical protein
VPLINREFLPILRVERRFCLGNHTSRSVWRLACRLRSPPVTGTRANPSGRLFLARQVISTIAVFRHWHGSSTGGGLLLEGVSDALGIHYRLLADDGLSGPTGAVSA